MNPMAFGPGPGQPGLRSVPSRSSYTGTDPSMTSSGPRIGGSRHSARPPGQNFHSMADIQSSRPQPGMMGRQGPRGIQPSGPRMSAAPAGMQGDGHRLSSAAAGPRQSAPFGGFGDGDFAKVGQGPSRSAAGQGFVEPVRSSRPAQSTWDVHGSEMVPQQSYGGGGGQQSYGGGSRQLETRPFVRQYRPSPGFQRVLDAYYGLDEENR
jgi:hypothetical protein